MFVCLEYVIEGEGEREREKGGERERGGGKREKERENFTEKVWFSLSLSLLRLGFVVSSVCLSMVCDGTLNDLLN